MKTAQTKNKSGMMRLPRKRASYQELSDFFDRHDGVDLLDQGIMEIDPDREDLERMLLEYWNQPNTKQLNIRIPPAAKRMIERLAKRKTVEVSTLVRMWVIESMRREARRYTWDSFRRSRRHRGGASSNCNTAPPSLPGPAAGGAGP